MHITNILNDLITVNKLLFNFESVLVLFILLLLSINSLTPVPVHNEISVNQIV